MVTAESDYSHGEAFKWLQLDVITAGKAVPRELVSNSSDDSLLHLHYKSLLLLTINTKLQNFVLNFAFKYY